MLLIIPWVCLWLLSSEELKALSPLISSPSLTSQGSGSYQALTPISQGSGCCDSWPGCGAGDSPSLAPSVNVSVS